MRCWLDLHIHSCLSPCANEDMTPNDIVHMAIIKGLDIIAITDHNSARNVRAVMEVGEKAGLVVIPGMELCTAEEIHLICLFSDLSRVLEFETVVYQNLSPLRNREEIFGSQIIMDADDNETGREDRLLSGACGLDMESALSLARGLEGIVIPAHVDRESYSMLNTLGTIPSEYSFNYLERSKSCRWYQLLSAHPELTAYRFITSSDAHFLEQILEREVFLDLPEKSIAAVLAALC